MLDKESHTAQMIRQDLEKAMGVPAQYFMNRDAPEDATIDRACISRASDAMGLKMAKKRAEGRRGWWTNYYITDDELRQMLREHIDKGDPVDVMNVAMMLYCRGSRTSAS